MTNHNEDNKEHLKREQQDPFDAEQDEQEKSHESITNEDSNETNGSEDNTAASSDTRDESDAQQDATVSSNDNPENSDIDAGKVESDPTLAETDPPSPHHNEMQVTGLADKRKGRPWMLSPAPYMILSIVLIAALVYVIAAKPFNKPVAAAVVNGHVISKDQLYNELLKSGGEKTLQQMIEKELINQQAVKKNIKVTDQDIQKQIDQIKKNFPDDSAFNQALQSQGMTLSDLKDQIAMNVKITKLVEPTLKITDAQLQKFFNQNKSHYGTPEQFRLSDIRVADKKTAENIRAMVQGGNDFATLAKNQSTDTTSSTKGGDLGYLTAKAMDPAVASAVAKQKVGYLSDVIQTQKGYEIVKVTGHKAAVVPKYDAVKSQVHDDYVNQHVSSNFQSWYGKIQSQAKIVDNVSKQLASGSSNKGTTIQ